MLKIVFLIPVFLLSTILLSCEIDLDRETGVEDEITPSRISVEDLLDTWILWTVDDETPRSIWYMGRMLWRVHL